MWQPIRLLQFPFPIYSGGRITGTRSEIYYEQGGMETLTPETEVVKYVELP